MAHNDVKKEKKGVSFLVIQLNFFRISIKYLCIYSVNENEVLVLYTSFDETANKSVLCGENVVDPMKFDIKINVVEITIHQFRLVMFFEFEKNCIVLSMLIDLFNF